VRKLVASPMDGRIKLYLMMTALRYRRDHPRLFLEGAYVPLESGGTAHTHVCAFSRRLDHHAVLAVVPRLIAGLMADPSSPPLESAVWGDTWVALPEGTDMNSRYRNLFTGEILVPTDNAKTTDGRPVLSLAEILASCPVALLEDLS
jgi:(1->4)-alpha-D-glucan 1-alpha-D-glucosylmutase